jgi:hypothetical protein
MWDRVPLDSRPPRWGACRDRPRATCQRHVAAAIAVNANLVHARRWVRSEPPTSAIRSPATPQAAGRAGTPVELRHTCRERLARAIEPAIPRIAALPRPDSPWPAPCSPARRFPRSPDPGSAHFGPLACGFLRSRARRPTIAHEPRPMLPADGEVCIGCARAVRLTASHARLIPS